MKKLNQPLILIMLLSINPGYGQKALTLEKSQQLALQHNHAIENSRLELKAAQQTRKAALTKYFPAVSAGGVLFEAQDPLMEITTQGGNLPVYDGNPLNLLRPSLFAYMPGATMGLLKSGTIGMVNVVQPVFAGGRIVNCNRLASLGVAGNERKGRMTHAEVLQKTEEQYWLVVSLEEKTKTIQKYESLLSSLRNQIEDAWKSGLVTKNDVLKVKLKQNEIQLNRSKLENGKKLAKMAFCQYIGIPYDSTLVMQDSLLIRDVPQTIYVDAQAAVQRRNEYQLLQASVQAATLQKRMKVGEYLPQVGVGVVGMYMKFDQGEDRTIGMAFATAAIPLSGWWEASHTVQEHRLKEQMAKNDLQDRTELLLLQIEKAWQDLNDAYRQVRLCEEAKIQAEENLKVNQDSYDHGVCSVSDLLEAQALQQQAMDQLTDAKTGYLLKKTVYLNATGR